MGKKKKKRRRCQQKTRSWNLNGHWSHRCQADLCPGVTDKGEFPEDPAGPLRISQPELPMGGNWWGLIWPRVIMALGWLRTNIYVLILPYQSGCSVSGNLSSFLSGWWQENISHFQYSGPWGEIFSSSFEILQHFARPQGLHISSCFNNLYSLYDLFISCFPGMILMVYSYFYI